MAIDFAPRSRCRNCNALIEFRQNHNGKWVPYDEDGTVHFVSCSARRDRPELPDDVCLSCGSLDVERQPGRGPHYAALVCRDCGAHRWLRRPK
jgi:hypothetical protein